MALHDNHGPVSVPHTYSPVQHGLEARSLAEASVRGCSPLLFARVLLGDPSPQPVTHASIFQSWLQGNLLRTVAASGGFCLSNFLRSAIVIRPCPMPVVPELYGDGHSHIALQKSTRGQALFAFDGEFLRQIYLHFCPGDFATQ